jgi:hypothetical protein
MEIIPEIYINIVTESNYRQKRAVNTAAQPALEGAGNDFFVASIFDNSKLIFIQWRP